MEEQTDSGLATFTVRALGALAQEHRLAAYRLLVQAGPDGLAAGALSEALGIPASSMSFHLSQLMGAGLVSQCRAGRSVIYSAKFGAMNALMSYLTENCCGGTACWPVEGGTQLCGGSASDA